MNLFDTLIIPVVVIIVLLQVSERLGNSQLFAAIKMPKVLSNFDN